MRFSFLFASLIVSFSLAQTKTIPAASSSGKLAPASLSSRGQLEQPVQWAVQASTVGAVNITQLRGKVVLIYYWSTNCPVCLDKMTELRDNIRGWRDKPFVMIAVNVDENRANFDSYAKISKLVLGNDAQCVLAYYKDLQEDTLWQKARLPVSYVIDSEGLLKYTFSGRIPAKAWDDIAELLP